MAFRVAVIGVGRFGREHARVYSGIEGVQLVGIVDEDRVRAQEVASKVGARAYPRVEDVIGQVDAVSVAVPTVAHVSVARAFLDRGIATFVEKPLARTAEEAEDLVQRARSRKTVLQVGHIERFNPGFRAVQGLITKPRFIESYRISPFPRRSIDIDVVLDVMIHDLDIVLHLAASEVTRVDAVGAAILFKHGDMADARVEFENGCVANLTASRIATETSRKMKIFSENTCAAVDFVSKSARVYTLSENVQAALKNVDRKVGVPSEEDLKSIPQDIYSIRDFKAQDGPEPLRVELESFVQAARAKSEPVVSGEHALRAIRVAERIRREIEEHRWR